MIEGTGHKKIGSLQRQWKTGGILFCLLLALSISLLLTLVLSEWAGLQLWVGVLFVAVSFPLLLMIYPYWRITMGDTARLLDKYLPELEESCGLLLRPVAGLGPLERLQAARTEARLLPAQPPHPLRKKLIGAGWLLAGVCLVCLLTAYIHSKPDTALLVDGAAVPASVPERTEPGVRSAHIRITPPAYTGRAVREQEGFDLKVEEGALLSWQVETTKPVKTLQFIMNDTVRLALKPEDTGHTSWRYAAPVNHSGFYQLRMDDQLSALYKIEVIRDEAPHIQVRTPKPYTIVELGTLPKVPLGVNVQDDYGITDAVVIATIASGSGEAVKFKEQTLHFDGSFVGNRPSYDLAKTIDLPSLGLKPGDELYFYIRARDNHGQETRSDMFIISLPDTAQLMSLDGLTTGVNIKPEYFRSERQIILETEQLLREKDTIPLQSFKDRSNDLGIDQKLLRLRYGKFLGEEAEEGDPFGDAGKNDLGRPEDFGNGAKILDAFTDKHDRAEDATYFEPGVKAQLKATLTEMWNAELRLRTFKPQEALPYAYKALRLLKDLQQQSRAFVAKTGVRVTPLDPAKRLTGKLDAIAQPVQHNVKDRAPDPADLLRIALALLDELRSHAGGMTGTGGRILEQASRQLGKEAAAHPGEYLSAYQSMRKILEGQISDKEVAEVAQAIRKLIPQAEAAASASKGPADAGLSRLYFGNLNK
jgi:hypothetical protein